MRGVNQHDMLDPTVVKSRSKGTELGRKTVGGDRQRAGLCERNEHPYQSGPSELRSFTPTKLPREGTICGSSPHQTESAKTLTLKSGFQTENKPC